MDAGFIKIMNITGSKFDTTDLGRKVKNKNVYIFMGWIVVLYLTAYNPLFIRLIIEPFALLLTAVIRIPLALAGNPVQQIGNHLISPGIDLEVTYKCSGVYQYAGYLAGVLSFIKGRQLIKSIVWGFVFLNVINIIRIISIYYIALFIPEVVNFVHAVIWEALMILFTLGMFFIFYKRFILSQERIGPKRMPVI